MCASALILLTVFLTTPLYGTGEYRGIVRKSDLSHGSGKIGKYTALIIGINDYEDRDIPDLKTAVADAEAVARILKERYGFRGITVLKNRQATRSAIDRALRRLIRSSATRWHFAKKGYTAEAVQCLKQAGVLYSSLGQFNALAKLVGFFGLPE